MNNFHGSVANSVPRATPGSVIRVKKEPVALETGDITKDKEEIQIKDVLDEMNLMNNTGEIGTQSEESASNGIGNGFGNIMSSIDGLLNSINDITKKISGGNVNNKKDDSLGMGSVIKQLLNVMKSIPQFTQDPNYNSKILSIIANYLKANVKDNGDPFGIYLLDIADMFADLDTYLNELYIPSDKKLLYERNQFVPQDKLQIIHQLGIYDFFNDVEKAIQGYSTVMLPVLDKIAANIAPSIKEINERTEKTNQMIKESIEKEKTIQDYNDELEKNRIIYKQLKVEEELAKLKPNPTEERLLYSDVYQKNLEYLRQMRE